MAGWLWPAGRWFRGQGETYHRLGLLVLLTFHALLATHSASQHSVTVDEGGHILSGVLAWRRGTFGVYPVNPPLVKMLAALPVAASGPDLPRQYVGGIVLDWVGLHDEFAKINQARYLDLVFRARCVIVALSVLGGWVVYLWGRDLFGPTAGLVAASLWDLCPNVIGWSGVVTTDLGAAVFGLLAVYSLRWYVQGPSWARAVCVGLMVGLGQLAKFTLLMLYPVVLAGLVLASRRDGADGSRSGGRARSPAAVCGDALLIGLLSLLVINAGYGFRESGRRLGQFEFRSDLLTRQAGRAERDELPTGTVDRLNLFGGTCWESLPVPLPESFVVGLDEQKSHADYGFPAYLRGQWQKGGWWYYYLYALAIKLPLGTWVLMGLAVGLALGSRRFRAESWEEWLLWLPAAAIFLLLSSQTGINAHSRYVLPAWPFVVVGVSRVGLLAEDAWRRRGRSWRAAALGAAIVVGALGWNLAALARIHPHELSYFNEVAGGPEQGWRHLIDSNFDWGQDLLFLKRWLEEHPEARPLRLAYCGGLDPHLVGLDYELPPPGPDEPWDPQRLNFVEETLGPQPGWYAVSVNLLCGMSFRGHDGQGRRLILPRDAYRYFRFFEPVGKAGYSIFIYHLTAEEANHVRALLGLPPFTGAEHDPSHR
jgi:hypothetical protein